MEAYKKKQNVIFTIFHIFWSQTIALSEEKTEM